LAGQDLISQKTGCLLFQTYFIEFGHFRYYRLVMLSNYLFLFCLARYCRSKRKYRQQDAFVTIV
jgi:hypothetical protein